MGNQQTVAVNPSKPQQFVSQAHLDWVKQVEDVYTSRPTLTKTVILPPGVELNDPRLTQGVVVAERTYMMPTGQFPEWPEATPFECDVDGRLLPPCWGENRIHAHYAVYPNTYFPELNCGYCNLHRAVNPMDAGEKVNGEPVQQVQQQQIDLDTKAGSVPHYDNAESDKERRITEETAVPRDYDTGSLANGPPSEGPAVVGIP